MQVLPTSRTDSIADLIKQSIATPYIKHKDESHAEIGYCIVDESNKIATKIPITSNINMFGLNTDAIVHRYINTVSFDMTSDGYIRFWTSNVNIYLKWEIKKDIAYLTFEVR